MINFNTRDDHTIVEPDEKFVKVPGTQKRQIMQSSLMPGALLNNERFNGLTNIINTTGSTASKPIINVPVHRDDSWNNDILKSFVEDIDSGVD